MISRSSCNQMSNSEGKRGVFWSSIVEMWNDMVKMFIYSFNLLFTMTFWVFMLIYWLNLIPNIKMSVMTCRGDDVDDYIQGYGHIFSPIWCDFDCFLWFLHKTLSVVFVRSCAHEKHKNVIEHSFITFSGSTRLYEKGTPLESSLSSFQTL